VGILRSLCLAKETANLLSNCSLYLPLLFIRGFGVLGANVLLFLLKAASVFNWLPIIFEVFVLQVFHSIIASNYEFR